MEREVLEKETSTKGGAGVIFSEKERWRKEKEKNKKKKKTEEHLGTRHERKREKEKKLIIYSMEDGRLLERGEMLQLKEKKGGASMWGVSQEGRRCREDAAPPDTFKRYLSEQGDG